MSNREHDNQKKLLFWIDSDMLSQFDEAIKLMGYSNRTEWFREKLRGTIKEAKMK
jgi:metal-responsive CopG/Arc/MetJ family transcriptional regulator